MKKAPATRGFRSPKAECYGVKPVVDFGCIRELTFGEAKRQPKCSYGAKRKV